MIKKIVNLNYKDLGKLIINKKRQDVFETTSKEEAEINAKKTGTEKVEWLENDVCKVTSIKMDAIRYEERIKSYTWFNSIILLHPAYHKVPKEKRQNLIWNVTYGDGEEIDDEDILSVYEIMQKEGVKYKWQKSDVLLVDNFICLHGRNSFEGYRKILATIAKN